MKLQRLNFNFQSKSPEEFFGITNARIEYFKNQSDIIFEDFKNKVNEKAKQVKDLPKEDFNKQIDNILNLILNECIFEYLSMGDTYLEQVYLAVSIISFTNVLEQIVEDLLIGSLLEGLFKSVQDGVNKAQDGAQSGATKP